MLADPRSTAIESLKELRDCLRLSADDPSDYVGQTERLIIAVESSHMEAIRFRLFGLRRQFAVDSESLPTGAVSLLDAAGTALKEAGFRT